MRSLVTIEDAQILALAQLARKERKSRAALIRQAIDDYLQRKLAASEEDAFGLWRKGKTGLAYLEKVRSEWERRCLTQTFRSIS